MSQHDYDIANGTGSAVRADINNALGAVVTNNSGSAAPTVTFPFMTWADTANDTLWMRNAANTAWINKGALSISASDYAKKSINQIQILSASVASNALTVNYAGGVLDFRNSALGNGTPVSGVLVAANSIVVPAGATLGSISGQQARLVLLEAYNGGSPVLCIANLAGGLQLDETNLISPVVISTGATSAGVIYSASAVSANSPYRIVGFIDVTEATAGTWSTAPSNVSGTGGQALAALSSLGYGQAWQNLTGSRSYGTTYYNTTGRPILVCITSTSGVTGGTAIVVNGVQAGRAFDNNGQIQTFCSAVVPPGASYVATLLGSGGYLNSWSELR